MIRYKEDLWKISEVLDILEETVCLVDPFLCFSILEKLKEIEKYSMTFEIEEKPTFNEMVENILLLENLLEV